MGSSFDGEVRRAIPADLPRIVDLEAVCLASDGWSEQAWQEEFAAAEESRHVVVAVRRGVVIGYASLLHGLDVSEVLRVGVEPTCRRTGVGRALLAVLLAAASATPVPAVMLEVRAGNEPAIELYARFGFAEIARRRAYYRDGDDALVLRLDLARPA